jgi:hypothetical protein
MYEEGQRNALDFQERSTSLTGTEMYAQGEKIPEFKAAVKKQNMLERKAGFVCKSTAGRVVVLLQPYDSTIYTEEPEKYPSMWGFKWSDDPKKALPFIAISTSPYMKRNCCTEKGIVYRSKMDNNVWSPSDYPQAWEVAE